MKHSQTAAPIAGTCFPPCGRPKVPPNSVPRVGHPSGATRTANEQPLCSARMYVSPKPLPFLLLSIFLTVGVARAQDDSSEVPSEVGAETEDVAEDPAGQVSYPVALGDVVFAPPEGALEPGSPPVQVVVSIVIDEEGLVIDAVLSAESGSEDLDATALRIASMLTFAPARLNGEPVLVTIDYPIRFVAPDPPPPPVIPAAI